MNPDCPTCTLPDKITVYACPNAPYQCVPHYHGHCGNCNDQFLIPADSQEEEAAVNG